MRFVDLFAGLGGFHVALARLGHECVFASEIDLELRQLYRCNFGMDAHGDVRKIPLADIPQHDVLCAGFPCQPFSKAGFQKGLTCAKNGDLAGVIVDWAHTARPRYLLLENVPNLLRHDGGRTWRWFTQELRHAGYSLDARVLSPHEHGVPQIRERLFIVGARDGLDHFDWPAPMAKKTDLRSVLDAEAGPETRLPARVLEALGAWDTFLAHYPRGRPKPWFPIWAAEFGATYPYATAAPMAVSVDLLSQFRGKFGDPIAADSEAHASLSLPPYARALSPMPSWKTRFVQLNRDLYEQNRAWIDPWLPQLRSFEHSFQKFEWNFDGKARSLWNSIIQLRGSGIRAKAATAAPALVAASSSQIPIIGWERRFMSARERARLQDLGELVHLPVGQGATTRALGNAVNARVVELIGKSLLCTSQHHTVAA